MGFPRHVSPTEGGPAAPPRAATGLIRNAALRMAAGCAVIGLSALTMGCAQSAESLAEAAPAPAQVTRPVGNAQVGHASYYSQRFNGRRTASGQRFDPASDTIAHRTLPFGTLVRVTNLQNGLTTTGTVQDRGPWTRGRIADLSPRIARQIDMMRAGVARVEIVPVELAEAPE
jgi:rare lipoprotein A